MTEDEKLPDESLSGVDNQALQADIEPKEPRQETVALADDEPEKRADDKTGRPKKSFKDKLRALPGAYWAKKKWTLPLTVVVLALLALAVPLTRYSTLGLFMKGHVEVLVVDSKTDTPVSGASVTVGGSTFKTDGSGRASGDAKLGNSELKVTKQYYTDSAQSVTVTLSKDKNKFTASLNATGRQVPVSVVNSITAKGVMGAEIVVLDTTAKTDKSGKATIVLPTSAATQKATVRVGGYNDREVVITVTDKVDPGNQFAVTPSGKIYFLSNQSGKIDVVKTNLDGSEREVVLAGTGKEEPDTTSLLASRDWKYLALLANRSGAGASVYLINTSNDKLTTIDEGSATFSLVGWSNDTFSYIVNRTKVENWQPKRQALKSYNASSGKLVTIEETAGQGSGLHDFAYTDLSNVYILDNELVYAQSWNASYYSSYLDGKSVTITSVKPDGTAKKTIKAFPVPSGQTYHFVRLAPYEPSSLYLQVPTGNSFTYYEYEDGSIKQKNDVTEAVFNQSYRTHLISPANNKTFWAEERDGKNTLFIGNRDAEDKKQIAFASEMNPYGWYTDEYLLLSQKSSELYILPVSGDAKAQKITNHYRPPISYYGYGGGYGGI